MSPDNKNNLDINTLASALPEQIPGFSGLQSARKFTGGQSNPTYLLQADSGQYVLRRQPPGNLLKSAHAVDREFRVLKALANSAVPVARALYLCEDTSVIGSLFYVMSYEPGDIFWDPALPEIEKEQRIDYYREIIRIMAAIHDVNVEHAGLADYGKPGNYFARQTARWTQQYRAAETEQKPAVDRLIHWLEKNCPEDDGSVSLVHGDFRLDNIIFHRGEARGQAVLDWELSTLGHPLADLAYFCMCLRLPPSQHSKGLGGLNREALAVPSEAEIIALYCGARGIDSIGRWNFYLAFSFFRLAAIVQGVYQRALQGNASNTNALDIGKLVDVLAIMACELID